MIIEAFVLKLGENVGTSFIVLLANFGRSSLNNRLLCDFSSIEINLNIFLVKDSYFAVSLHSAIY